jgi:drug/metabolite transporter (DMT)-like permease
MTLTAYLVAGVVLYTLLITFSSRASGKIDPFWSSTIFGIASTIIPFVLWAITKQSGKPMIQSTSAGVAFSIAAGAAAGIFTACMVKIFEKGAVSYAAPIVYGGAIVATALIGWALFHEKIPPLQALGIVCVVFGIGLVTYSKLSGAAA